MKEEWPLVLGAPERWVEVRTHTWPLDVQCRETSATEARTASVGMRTEDEKRRLQVLPLEMLTIKQAALGAAGSVCKHSQGTT